MNDTDPITEIGELGLIKIIEELIKEKTGQILARDDVFHYKLDIKNQLIFNSDMFISTTDAPRQMSHYEMGRKAVLMNISDILVKGVRPIGIIVSLGIPSRLKVHEFKSLMEGIIDFSRKWNLEYIGGDINESMELIINPTVFGIKNINSTIPRNGAKIGDILVSNGKFGLTGVGFDILLNKDGYLEDVKKYQKSINSVLNPEITGLEAEFLADEDLASSSIDSSDGLLKSLGDLMLSNPDIGFEIEFNEDLIDHQVFEYFIEYEIELEDLVLKGGEEFIHLFTINPNNFKIAKNLIESKGGKLYKIGKVIAENKIYLLKESKRFELKPQGYEHFT